MNNRILSLLAGVALCAGAGVVSAAEPVALTDAQMDGVTAGILVGSTATSTATGFTAATIGAATGAAAASTPQGFTAATTAAATGAAFSNCCAPASASARTGSFIIFP